MKSLYDIPKVGYYLFTTYHLYFKNKLRIIDINKKLVINSIISAFPCNGADCIA